LAEYRQRERPLIHPQWLSASSICPVKTVAVLMRLHPREPHFVDQSGYPALGLSDELRAKVDSAPPLQGLRMDAPAQAVASLENNHRRALPLQSARSCKSGDAAADHDDVRALRDCQNASGRRVCSFSCAC
jgi:hypothetical protein